MRKKTFKDQFGKEIKAGDSVLNVWANSESYSGKGDGGPGIIQYRIGKVIKINPASIRIEYKNNNGDIKHSNSYNTSNRIFLLIDGTNIEVPNKFKEKLIEKDEKIKKLKTQLEKSKSTNKLKVKQLENKIEDLKDAIRLLQKGGERFHMLQL